MACTTKSILPHFSLSTSNTASMVAGSVTSQWPSRMPPSSLASGSTRFFSASPCQVRAISAPAAWQAFAISGFQSTLIRSGGTPALPAGTAQIRASVQGCWSRSPNSRNSGVISVLSWCQALPVQDAERTTQDRDEMTAFRQSIEAMIPALRRYARALARDADIADDLVQDTLVRALRSERLFLGGDVRSWLYTILTNLNKNRRRSLARRPQFMPLLENNPDASGTEAEGRDIARALSTLVEEQRAVLLLVMLEGLSYREVADIQGVPIGTVMSRLARARAHVKASLEGERPALRRVK